MTLEDDLALALAAADAAGAILRDRFRVPLGVEVKEDGSPVSAADRAAEQAMRTVLAAARPEDGIEGEEAGTEQAEARRCWVIDPIDGTRAFITGRPSFATLVALVEDGVPVLGVIDQPVTRERWVGARGVPTRFNGPIGGIAGTRSCGALGAAELSCTAPEMFGEADRLRFERLRHAVRRVSWGGDAYAHGLLALGHIDIVAEAGMQVWDWAALVPVVEGAGGRVTGWSGEALRADGDGRVLAVGDPALLAPSVALLTG